ncbi:MAG: hypothetical protein HYU43_09195, partial [Armatimonadetes bacterium]|nr:hypothetical protein [Armatimonadota bacterium]
MKAKRIENAREFLKRNRPLRWTVLLGVGLAALSGTLLPTSAQAAVPVSLTLKGQWPGSATGRAYDVAVQGQYAYVADGDAGLQVIDVSNPVNPVRVGGVDTSGSAIGVAVAG